MNIALTHTRRSSYRIDRTLKKILASCPGFEAYAPDNGFPVFLARSNSKKGKYSAAGFLSGCLLFEPENGVRATSTESLTLTGIEVSAAVQPHDRRQGIFTELLKGAVSFSRQHYPELPLTGPLPDCLAHSHLAKDPLYKELLMQLTPDHLPKQLPSRQSESAPGQLPGPWQVPVSVKASCQDELVKAVRGREAPSTFIWQLVSDGRTQYLVYGQLATQDTLLAPDPFTANAQLLAQLFLYFGTPWCVSDVWVPKEKRGNGYASLLLSQVLSHLSGLCDDPMQPVFLQVRDSNVPACKTYQELGFKTVQQQRFYRFDRLFD